MNRAIIALELAANESATTTGQLFEGCPPCLSRSLEEGVQQQHVERFARLQGFYFQSLVVQQRPDLVVEVSNVQDSNELEDLLLEYHNYPRRLILGSSSSEHPDDEGSSSTSTTDTRTTTSTTSCHGNNYCGAAGIRYRYKLTLPTGDLGMKFKGFPAEIESVARDSPVYGKLCAGQVLDGLIIPGRLALTATQLGDISGSQVRNILQAYASVENRQLVVIVHKDE